ncbi:MAG TPA: CU044_5270 family protein [Actinomycetes bacterium]
MNDLETLHDAWSPPEAPSHAAYAEARAALLARAAGDPGRAPARRLRLPRIGVRRVAVGALALALAAGVTVVENLGGTDPHGRPRSIVPGLSGTQVANAAEALERAAVFAETRAALTPRPNQWIFTKERVSFLTPGPNKGHVNYGWGRVDGKGTAFLDENGKLRFRPAIKPPTGRHARKLPPEPWTYPALTKLPTDPHALLRWVRKSSGGSDWAAEAFDQFTAILRRGGLVPPKLEAAVFRAMARLPGVRLSQGPAVEGHATLAVGRTNGSLYEGVLLDRKTFAYRGERTKLVKEDVGFERAKGIGPVGHAKGTVWLFERLVTAVVDRPGQLP